MSKLLDYMKGEEADLNEQEFSARKSASTILWVIGALLGLWSVWRLRC